MRGNPVVEWWAHKVPGHQHQSSVEDNNNTTPALINKRERAQRITCLEERWKALGWPLWMTSEAMPLNWSFRVAATSSPIRKMETWQNTTETQPLEHCWPNLDKPSWNLETAFRNLELYHVCYICTDKKQTTKPSGCHELPLDPHKARDWTAVCLLKLGVGWVGWGWRAWPYASMSTFTAFYLLNILGVHLKHQSYLKPLS